MPLLVAPLLGLALTALARRDSAGRLHLFLADNAAGARLAAPAVHR